MTRQVLLLAAAAVIIGACTLSSAAAPTSTNPPVTVVSTPSPTPTPSGANVRIAARAPQIISFTVSPNPIERGQDLIAAWQVNGASQATLWQLTYDSKLDRWYRQPDPISAGSNIGEYRLTMPGDARQSRNERTYRVELGGCWRRLYIHE